MRSLVFIVIACVITMSVFAATPTPSGTACTTALNPFGARCANANCFVYTDGSGNNLTGYSCKTAATGYTAYASTTYGPTVDGSVNDYICSASCDATDKTVAPCDASTGLLCSTCATNYAASGKTPSSTSMQPCGCVTTTVSGTTTQTCASCAHGYYGVDSNSTAVTPSDSTGSTDATYALVYGSTAAAKCVACPTTLTNCAQCASATTCYKCTSASGNTPDSSGSCSAAKIVASVAFAFAGLVALLF